MSKFVDKILLEIGDLNNINYFDFSQVRNDKNFTRYTAVDDNNQKIDFDFSNLSKEYNSLKVFVFAFGLKDGDKNNTDAAYLFKVYKTALLIFHEFISTVKPDLIMFYGDNDKKHRIYVKLVDSNNISGYHKGVTEYDGHSVLCVYRKDLDKEVKDYFDLK